MDLITWPLARPIGQNFRPKCRDWQFRIRICPVVDFYYLKLSLTSPRKASSNEDPKHTSSDLYLIARAFEQLWQDEGSRGFRLPGGPGKVERTWSAGNRVRSIPAGCFIGTSRIFVRWMSNIRLVQKFGVCGSCCQGCSPLCRPNEVVRHRLSRARGVLSDTTAAQAAQMPLNAEDSVKAPSLAEETSTPVKRSQRRISSLAKSAQVHCDAILPWHSIAQQVYKLFM